jgi:hypothetical protein
MGLFRDGIKEFESESTEICYSLDLLPSRSFIRNEVGCENETVLRRVSFGEVGLEIGVSGESFVSYDGNCCSYCSDCKTRDDSGISLIAKV